MTYLEFRRLPRRPQRPHLPQLRRLRLREVTVLPRVALDIKEATGLAVGRTIVSVVCARVGVDWPHPKAVPAPIGQQVQVGKCR